MPKVFYNGLAFLPTVWCKAILGEDWDRRANASLLVVANVKKDVAALLTDRGLSQSQADNLAEDLRLQRQPFGPTDINMLVDAGVIDPGRAGVYLWYRAQKDRPVVRVEPDGTITTVAHFRYDSRRGGRDLWVEAA